MPPTSRRVPRTATDPSFILLCALLGILWLAGGASRADAGGQVVVRAAAWATLVALPLFGLLPSPRRVRPALILLTAGLCLVLLQLLPLPPDIWRTLPGREPLAAAALAGTPQPWRPAAMAPGGALNAAGSLVVPFSALLLAAGLDGRAQARLPGVLLGLATASALLALLQASGAVLDYPLVNDSAGQVSGNFANRNHLALFLAMGLLVAPYWGTSRGPRLGWRAPAALALIILFVLTILASGSRAGIATGALAMLVGPLVALDGIRRALDGAPRRVPAAILLGLAGVVASAVALSIAVDRAASIDRALGLDVARDMRARGLPTVLDAIGRHFPAGTGFGSFDRVFAMYEPFALLKPTYFNHAHNDYLEVVLEGGIAGAALLAAALGWWAFAGARAWRAGPDGGPDGEAGGALARLGAATLLLVLVASAFDYPARTPMIMGVSMIAAAWLAAGRGGAGAALPNGDQGL